MIRARCGDVPQIFDPLNPLVDFVKFHRAFVQCRFASGREHLRRFVGRRTEADARPLEPFSIKM